MATRPREEGKSQHEATATNHHNHLQPTTPSQRTSTAWDMASLWISLILGVPSYYIAGSLVEEGMTWWQGIIVIVSAKALLLLPLILTSHPGTRYGIPFPVLARSSFGVHGAHLPSFLRTLVACGWFGIETWIGAQAIYLLLPYNSIKDWTISQHLPWLGTSPVEFLCYLIFSVIELALCWNGMQGIKKMERYSAPILVLLATLLLIWSYLKAGGFGPILSQPSKLSLSEFWYLFFPSITANIGSWAAVALSIPDFTRYARSQRDQVLGQLGIPVFMGCFAFIGLAVTSSTQIIFGHAISNPITLLSKINNSFTMILFIPAITLVIVTTNIPANIVAPANFFMSLNPKLFTFRKAALLTSVLSIGFQPWKIFGSTDSFVYTWLISYSAIMGPLAGIVLTDYYLVNRMTLNLDELYSFDANGRYYYYKGWNLVALGSFVIGVVPIVPGFLHKVGILKTLPETLIFIYSVGWFFGFFTGSLMYGILSLRWGAKCRDGGVDTMCSSLHGPLLLSSVEVEGDRGDMSDARA